MHAKERKPTFETCILLLIGTAEYKDYLSSSNERNDLDFKKRVTGTIETEKKNASVGEEARREFPATQSQSAKAYTSIRCHEYKTWVKELKTPHSAQLGLQSLYTR